MSNIIKHRWIFLVLWMAFIIALLMFIPNLGDLVREKGGLQIPDSYPSQMAGELLNEFSGVKQDADVVDIVAVFQSDKELLDAEMKNTEYGINNIIENKKSLDISNTITHVGNPELTDQVVSKDKSTVIASFSVMKNDRSIDDIKRELSEYLSKVNVRHYLTGSELLFDDFLKVNEEGVKKTELITIAFILIILIFVFRSPVTPIISLFTIASAFLASLGVVAQLVANFSFPFSSFSQIFLVLVLFGIGTDYNILLLARFKEELESQKPVSEAIIATYKTAGKTVLFSGLTVLIGFSSLALAKFSIYRAGSAVAIGISILLLEIFTLLPFFMKLLGHKLFWPLKVSGAHKGNKGFERISRMAVKYPVLALIVVAAISVPSFFSQNLDFSYNSLRELNDSFDSVKALNIISDTFGIGKALPTTLVLKNNMQFVSSESLGEIDKITEEIKNIKGVKKVYSVTQPKGEAIDMLYVNKQTESITGGISSADKDIKKIEYELGMSIDKLNLPLDFSKVDELIKGSQDVGKGLYDISNALSTIEGGLNTGVLAAGDLNIGVNQLKNGIEQLDKSTVTLIENYKQLQEGFNTMSERYVFVEQQISLIESAFNGMKTYSLNLAAAYPQIEKDPSYIALVQTEPGLSA